MSQQIENITLRLREIDQERHALDAEHAMLLRVQRSLGAHAHLVNEDDVFSHRTAAKFELLARVAEYLNSEFPLLYGGATTKEIYKAVISSIEQDAGEAARFNASRQRIEDGLSPDPGTTLVNAKDNINYNTFRSYLTRFKDEGRIFFDEERRRWRVTTDAWSITGPEEEDLNKDYS